MVAALILHDPDPRQSPMRRAGTTALVGLLIAALSVGAVAVYGLITGNSSVEIRDESVVFLEKGTGARYVYLREDDRLHPVLNYSSGLLIAAAAKPKLVTVSRERLARVPIGQPLGIKGAPDSLPEPEQMRGADWSVCSASEKPDQEPLTTVVVGEPVTGGKVSTGLLVQAGDGSVFLIVGGHRFRIPDSRVQRALGWNTQQPFPVATGFLNAVPLRQDLVAPEVPGFGRPSAVAGVSVGQLFTDGTQWSVTLIDGTAPVTDVQARLLRAAPRAYEPRTLAHPAFTNLPASTTRLDQPGLPHAVPDLSTPAARVCLALTATPEGQPAPEGRVLLDPEVPAGSVTPEGTGVRIQADFVHVARGAGALAVTANTVSLVTDGGLRHSVASREQLTHLGYARAALHRLPAEIVALLPEGPALDAAKARTVAR